MTIKPIIFSGPMIRAILREIEAPGTGKTQTRRIVKPQPEIVPLASELQEDHELRGWECIPVGEDFAVVKRWPYKPGDLLWVREAHAILPRLAYRMSIGTGTIDQREHPTDGYSAAVFREGFDRSGPPRWRPSIHMPRWASRITLRVTGVRCERLRDISEADAKAEGSAPWTGAQQSYVTDFFAIWARIHGPDAWDKNPWVWAVTFQPIAGNVDQIKEAS